MTKLTIKELSKLAGVSQTAVSFVLNGKPGVSEKTRKAVLDIIEQTNYKSDRNSKRLALQKSFNICLAYLDTSSPFDDLFYFEVAKGMLHKSGEYGYNIVLSKIDYTPTSYKLPDVITAKDADGVIIFQDVNLQITREIESYGLPCVVVDAHSTTGQVTSVALNAERYTYEGVQYLLHKGHEKIGIISSSFIPDFWAQSYSGYAAALAQKRLMINPSWVQNTAFNEESAYQCMEKMIQSGPLPTAIFCGGDIFAIGAMRCLKDHGIKVPDAVSFIGVDNIFLGKYFEPALTTIDLSKSEMGEIALDLLMQKINGEPVESVLLNASGIIERKSVCTI